MHWRSVGLALAVVTSVATAQSRPTVTVTAPASSASGAAAGPMVRLTGVFGDGRSRDLLSNGFPARIAIEIELWGAGRLGDQRLGGMRSERIVQFDALSGMYRVARVVGDSVVPEGRHPTLAALTDALSTPQRVPLAPPSGGRGMYYSARVTIETLTRSDLAEVERWLRGDLRPALTGRADPTSPVRRGLRTLVSRLLGGQVVRVEGRSARFDR
jgi:hypothetical protein